MPEPGGRFSAFVCPIAWQTFCDPVLTADGHSFERAHIEAWFRAGHRTSPLTGCVLPHATLLPNHALRNAVDSWRTFCEGCGHAWAPEAEEPKQNAYNQVAPPPAADAAAAEDEVDPPPPVPHARRHPAEAELALLEQQVIIACSLVGLLLAVLAMTLWVSGDRRHCFHLVLPLVSSIHFVTRSSVSPVFMVLLTLEVAMCSFNALR